MASSSVFLTEDKFLGRGGFGSVYLHYDEQTNAFVAVKRIDVGLVDSEDPNIAKALTAVRKEISLMKDLDHKRIVQYIRDGRESNIFCIYMEYVCGGTVENELIKNGALSEDTTKKYTLQLLEGLSYLHGKHIIHRDVKGSNILCDGNGNIKLADFGISKQMGHLHTLTCKASTNTAMRGTAYWMAPEVMNAEHYGTTADIWSTGATVVQMLTAHPPWHRLEQMQAMFKIARLEKGGYTLDSKISRDAKDFLDQTFMLEEQRPSADKLLQHSWLKAANEDKFLGKGAYGSVYLHYDKNTNALVAVKRMDVGPVKSEDANVTKELKAVHKEISMMKDLNHKRIVQYIRGEQQSNIFSIYMEYMCGGSVADELHKNGALSEDTTRKYTLQLLEGLSYLHHKRIIHRDVKGSNILCDGNGNIKLAGFGISKQMNDLHTLTSEASKNTAVKGTIYWMAPEVIKAENYGTRADIWSTASTVVEMLTAHPPWYELEQMQAMLKIANLEKGGYALDSKISSDAWDFLTQTFMLEEKRPSADKLLQHSWLKAVYAPINVERTTLTELDDRTKVVKDEASANVEKTTPAELDVRPKVVKDGESHARSEPLASSEGSDKGSGGDLHESDQMDTNYKSIPPALINAVAESFRATFLDKMKPHSLLTGPDSKINKEGKDLLTQVVMLAVEKIDLGPVISDNIAEPFIPPKDIAGSLLTGGTLVGKGGFGSVYLRDDGKGRQLAVKEIEFNSIRSAEVEQELKLLQNEVALMREFDHERIVRYIGSEMPQDTLYIFMEYMPGGSIRTQLNESGSFSEAMTKRYTKQMLEGLCYLHNKRIIHRDVKGDNTLLDGEGNIKLSDFGLTRQMTNIQTLTGNSSMTGTPYFMSPQVITGEKYGRRTDIWSTGATVVEMLTTHPPWHKLSPFDAMREIAMQKRAEYVLDPSISGEARSFLALTFTPEEADRPRAEELLTDPWLQEE